MSSGRHKKDHQHLADQQDMAQNAAMENFVRLQESQEEFLKWFDSAARKPDVDRYAYKKIR